MIRNTQLYFALETLHNAYDQKDWTLAEAMCQFSDRISLTKNMQGLNDPTDKTKTTACYQNKLPLELSGD